MRTTLDIDDDVLLAVKEIAKREAKSAGAIASALLRKAISGTTDKQEEGVKEPQARYGFQPFARRGGIVTNEVIDQLREEVGD